MAKSPENLTQIIKSAKTLIFGENNSRLDYLIEKFYQLNHERRSMIIFISIISAIILFILVILIYTIFLFSWQNKLNNAFYNMNMLHEFKNPYTVVHKDFQELINKISNANANISMVSVLEQKAKELGIKTSISGNSNPIITKFPNQNPLAEHFHKETIELKLSEVSLKKIIEYINAIEHMPNKFKVIKFHLISNTSLKLYFDVILTIEVIIPEEN